MLCITLLLIMILIVVDRDIWTTIDNISIKYLVNNWQYKNRYLNLKYIVYIIHDKEITLLYWLGGLKYTTTKQLG